VSRRVLLIALGGLLVRLGLAPFTAWTPDFAPWLARMQEMAHGVPLYQNLTFSYPPLYAYALALFTGPVAFLLGFDNLSTHVFEFQRLSLDTQLIATDIPHPLFVLAAKLPMIVADLGTGLLLAQMARELTGSSRRAELAAAAWFFNPLSIWVGSVHGQFDPIPAFLTVLALSLMWRRQWLGVGVALSLGILFKLYPVYLLPLAALFAFTDEPWRAPSKRGVRRPIWNLMLLFVGVLIPLDLYLPALARSSLATAVFSRAETRTVGTGLDLWFPTILPGVQAAMIPVARIYSQVLQLVLYGGLVLVAWRAIRGADRALTQLEAFTGVLLLVLLTSPSTNPQFLVWVLPLLVLAWAVRPGYVRLIGVVGAVLSVVPVLFYLGLWGGSPLGILAPSIAYLSWPTSASGAADALTGSLGTIGPQAIPLRLWMMFLIALVTVAALLVALVPFLIPPRRRETDSERRRGWRLVRPPMLAALFSLGAMLLAGVGVTAAVQGLYVGPDASAAVTPDGLGASVQLVAGTRPVTLNLVAGPMAPSRPVYVLVDSQYPTLLTTFQNVKGLYDHLAIALPAGSYGAPVSRVSAAEMALQMRRTPNAVVVVGSGAMPDTVLGPNRDFAPVKDFLAGGGELVFAGDGLFYWAARQGQQSFSLRDSRSRIDWAGGRAVLGYDLVHDPIGDPSGEILGDMASSTARALDVSNRLAQRGARLSVLPTVGGWDAGVDTTSAPFSQRTSLAVVPVGAGRLVLFGGGLQGSERVIANDLTKILLSGTDIGAPLATASVALAANARQSALIPLGSPVAAGGWRLLAFAPSGFDYYHQSLAVAAGPAPPAPAVPGPAPPGATPSAPASAVPRPSASASPSASVSPRSSP
jgi:hypothetical protein